MKTNTISSRLFLIVLLVTTVLSSCEDDEKTGFTNDPVKKEKVGKVLAFREELNFVNRFVAQNVMEGSGEEGRKSFRGTILSRLQEVAPCAEATEDELPDGIVKLTMDFGDGCQTDDGIVVAGKVVMTFSVNENEFKFEYSLEFIDYKEIGTGEFQGEVVNGTVEGNFTLDLMSEKFTQEMEQNLTITYANNTEAIYVVVQKSEMTDTGLRIVEMETSGNFADGGQFLMTLNKTLVYDFSCEGDFPVKGEETLTFQGNVIKVNYGNGSCDTNYTVK